MITMEFRAATINDLPVIAEIFLRCWTISYKSVLSESARDSFTLENAAELWRKSIEIPGDGHLFSLYVDPDSAGRGFGKSALKEAIERNRACGFTEMTLWVFANNDVANSLYTKNGFAPTGKTRTTPEWGALEIELIAAL